MNASHLDYGVLNRVIERRISENNRLKRFRDSKKCKEGSLANLSYLMRNKSSKSHEPTLDLFRQEICGLEYEIEYANTCLKDLDDFLNSRFGPRAETIILMKEAHMIEYPSQYLDFQNRYKNAGVSDYWDFDISYEILLNTGSSNKTVQAPAPQFYLCHERRDHEHTIKTEELFMINRDLWCRLVYESLDNFWRGLQGVQYSFRNIVALYEHDRLERLEAEKKRELMRREFERLDNDCKDTIRRFRTSEQFLYNRIFMHYGFNTVHAIENIQKSEKDVSKKTRCDLISAITNPVQDCQELGPSAKRVSVDRSEVVLQRADSNQTTQNSFEMLTKKVEALSKQVEEWSYTTIHTLDLMDSRLRSIRNLPFDCRRVCRTGSQDVPVSSAGA